MTRVCSAKAVPPQARPLTPPLSSPRAAAGPVNSVNVFASQRYDKAICGFLFCLQEFAEFAHAKDVSNGVAKPFEMSYKIDGDKARGRWISTLQTLEPPPPRREGFAG